MKLTERDVRALGFERWQRAKRRLVGWSVLAFVAVLIIFAAAMFITEDDGPVVREYQLESGEVVTIEWNTLPTGIKIDGEKAARFEVVSSQIEWGRTTVSFTFLVVWLGGFLLWFRRGIKFGRGLWVQYSETGELPDTYADESKPHWLKG